MHELFQFRPVAAPSAGACPFDMCLTCLFEHLLTFWCKMIPLTSIFLGSVLELGISLGRTGSFSG